MSLINNPLADPLFAPVAVRLAIIMGVGFVLVVLFNIRNLRALPHSEVWKRYLGWLLMAPTFMLGIFCGGLVAVIFVAFLIHRASKEYWIMLNLPFLYRRLLILNALMSLAMAAFLPQLVCLLPIAYFLVIVLASILNNQLEEIFNSVCYTLFGSIWIAFPLVHFLLFPRMESGKGLLILIAFSIALADVLAFCVGRAFTKMGIGVKHIIADLISPNKTYAGVAGNLLGALIGTLAFASLNTNVAIQVLLLMAVLIGAASVVGDLAESMIKRFCNIKDSSDCIPGHGGLLDRIDSMLVVIVVCYYFLVYFPRSTP